MLRSVREHTSIVRCVAFGKRWHECLWNLRKSHPVMLTLARSPRAIENEFNISGVTLIRNEVCLINGILPFSRHARLFSSVICILYSQVFFLVHLLTCFLQQRCSCVSTFHADVKNYMKVTSLYFCAMLRA